MNRRITPLLRVIAAGAPATDTIAPDAPATSDSFGPGAVLLAVSGLVGFAIVDRRLATRRVREDQG